MAIQKLRKNQRGWARCGRCGRDVRPGDTYFAHTFREGGRAVRCAECPHARDVDFKQEDNSVLHIFLMTQDTERNQTLCNRLARRENTVKVESQATCPACRGLDRLMEEAELMETVEEEW